MSNPYTSHTGTVTDVHGRPVAIGTDCDAVTIGQYVIGLAAMDDLMRLAFTAEEDAKAWAEAHGEDEGDAEAHAAQAVSGG
jgi:hypothetical protein